MSVNNRGCMVLFCKSRGVIPGISYFSLTPARRDTWLRALGRNPDVEHPSAYNCICSLHFSEEDIIMKNKRRFLRPGAIPLRHLGLRKPLSILQHMHKPCGHQGESAKTSSSVDTEQPYSLPSTSYSCLITQELECLEVEKETYFMDLEVPTDNKENNASSNFSTTSSSTLSADSPIVELEKGNSLNQNRVQELKRKFDSASSSSCDSGGFKGPIKKARRTVKTLHNYSKNPKFVEENLKSAKIKKNMLCKKLKVTRRRVKLLSLKVTSLKHILFQLKKKKLLDNEALSVLEKSYSGIPLILLKRALSNIRLCEKNKKQSREPFPPELRSFALTLQFYSSKAYNYVRKVFNLALPSPSTIRSWVKNIHCEPGFSDCSFLMLKRKVEENNNIQKPTICALMLDEMAIKKQIEVRGSRIWGYEDLGTEISNDAMKCATEALTLMVVAINDSWKVPIAYFLISALGGVAKANIIKEAIDRLTQIGVKIVSVTCDGPSAHFAMAENLGANICDINKLTTYFKNPDDSRKIFIIFDAVHMLKLIRNNWATLGIFLDEEGNEINFHYITKLAKVQEDEFCRLGTKLRKVHLEWKNHKMKVNLAAQTLSRSVADALEFLLEVHPEFKNAAATIKFLKIVDELFDITNSRNPFGRGTKSPLQKGNEGVWKPKIIYGIEYLKKLRSPQGQLLVNTRNKPPIRGMCITLTSLLGLYDELVNKEILKYLLTSKFSQDHLELFFCCIRGRNGWNNNPTSYQFYYTYKRLALNMDIKSFTGNCMSLDNTHILSTKANKVIMPPITTDDMSIIKKYNIDINDMMINEEDIEGIVKILPTLSTITENIVAYIAGFVAKQLRKSVKCLECLTFFIADSENKNLPCLRLFHKKNRGRLISPKNDLISVCFYIEKKIRQTLLITNQFMPKETNFIATFNTEISMYLFENQYFKEIDDHIFACSFGEESHRMKILKLVTKIYTKIRFFNVAKEQSLNVQGTSIRKTYSKLILFHHQ